MRPKQIVDAVDRNGDRLKDFFHVHYLLEYRSMQEVTDAYMSKYRDTNAFVVRNALRFNKCFSLAQVLRNAWKCCSAGEVD